MMIELMILLIGLAASFSAGVLIERRNMLQDLETYRRKSAAFDQAAIAEMIRQLRGRP